MVLFSYRRKICRAQYMLEKQYLEATICCGECSKVVILKGTRKYKILPAGRGNSKYDLQQRKMEAVACAVHWNV